MRELLLIPLEDVVVFPNMTVTLSVDVGDETEVLLVPSHDGSHAAVGTVATVGDRVRRGQRIGLIRFGSRVDLTFPTELRVTVRVGNRLRGGATVVATTTEPV